jgi:negative regulator of replication initiation
VNAVIPTSASVIKTLSQKSPVNPAEVEDQKIFLDEVKAVEENLYSDEYYDKMVKKMFEDPQVNKKQLINKLLSYLQSQDYTALQKELNN